MSLSFDGTFLIGRVESFKHQRDLEKWDACLSEILRIVGWCSCWLQLSRLFFALVWEAQSETNFIQDVWKMKQCYQRSKLVLPLSFIFCLYNSVCRSGVWWRPSAEVVDPCPDLQICELCHNMSPEQAVCFDYLTISLGGFLWILRIWMSRNRVLQKVDIRRAESLDVAQGPLWSDILGCCACTKDMSATPVFDCSVCRCACIPMPG